MQYIEGKEEDERAADEDDRTEERKKAASTREDTSACPSPPTGHGGTGLASHSCNVIGVVLYTAAPAWGAPKVAQGRYRANQPPAP